MASINLNNFMNQNNNSSQNQVSGKIDIDKMLNNLEKEADQYGSQAKIVDIQENYTISEYVRQNLITCETVGFCYNDRRERAEVYTNNGERKNTAYFDISTDEYNELCKEYRINLDEKFNDSNWFEDHDGNLIRVFAMLPPVVPYANVTINISRVVKDYSLSEYPQEVQEMIPYVVSNRFIVVGQTGSGKTYFLNRALKKTFSGKYDNVPPWSAHNNNVQNIRSGVPGGGVASVNMSSKDMNAVTIPKNVSQNRIALVEEFHEIFEPNKNTVCMSSCPVKPGQPNMFSYIVQQTNLMRLDHILVGEIKGEESFHFINNLNSGIRGGATCHGCSAEDGLLRLRILMSLSGHCSIDLAGQLIANALDFVIYIEKHRIKEIKRVSGVYNIQSQKFQTEDLYRG